MTYLSGVHSHSDAAIGGAFLAAKVMEHWGVIQPMGARGENAMAVDGPMLDRLHPRINT
jgi:hypothetical protein